MDHLTEDTIILIAKKVAEHGTQALFNFMRTSKTQLVICRFPAFLKSMPPEHVDVDVDEHVDDVQILKCSG